MKKIMMITIMVFISFLGLVACSNDDANDDNIDEIKSDNENNDQQQDENDIEDDEKQDKVKKEDEESSGGKFEVEVEDQLDLGIGDTGIFDTTLGKYEMTLNSAELLGTEFDGEETLLDELILLEITIKNVSDSNMKIEELMESMGVSSDLEGSNSYDGAEDFESIEKFEGDIAPGEEKTGKLITDVYSADEYYFKKDSGNIAAGSSNQVIWTIKADEVR